MLLNEVKEHFLYSLMMSAIGAQTTHSAQLARVALFRKVPEVMLTLYDFFENEEQQISLVLLLGKNIGEAIQQTFFSVKK